VEKGVSFAMLSMYNNLFSLFVNGLQSTRRLHWRTNHCFALVSYKLAIIVAPVVSFAIAICSGGNLAIAGFYCFDIGSLSRYP
jgi:hypothetical protein